MTFLPAETYFALALFFCHVSFQATVMTALAIFPFCLSPSLLSHFFSLSLSAFF
jgi:hypothetical protein